MFSQSQGVQGAETLAAESSALLAVKQWVFLAAGAVSPALLVWLA